VRHLGQTQLAVAFVGLVGACVLPSIDLSGRPCPCITGYSCDASTHRCVLGENASSAGGSTSSESGATSTIATGAFASSTSTVGSGGGDLTQGLVAAYPFEEGIGTTTADTSGNSFDGTLVNGPIWTTGRIGNALTFDGVNDYVIGPSFAISGSMTLSAWIYQTGQSPSSDDAAIISAHSTGGYQLDTTIDRGPRTIGFKLFSSTNADMDRYGATAITFNQWHHVAGVYDASAKTMDVYLDGHVDNGTLLGPVEGSQLPGNVAANIGRRPDDPLKYEFNGKLDEIRIYNRALSAAEILELYQLAP
jgi:Concanavalin A-like lectin/glucanases superfamily